MNIGIITMHKVQNYGSALQAYALQKHLQKSTCATVELIDYKYPNRFHKIKKPFNVEVRNFLGYWRNYFFKGGYKSKKLFSDFHKDFFSLTLRQYNTISELETNAPQFDIYITGSDQVWNPNTAKGDPIMFCSFAPAKSKIISFAASFSVNTIPTFLQDNYRNMLSRYSHIGMREESGVKLLDELCIPKEIKTMCVCDPTLLLSAKEYDKLAMRSTYKIEGKYILVYYLNYAYNPEPAISTVVKKLKDLTGYNILVLGRNKLKYDGKFTHVDGIGPNEFVSIFKNASYVITSSFHGTMFSLINRIPFYSILPGESSHDKRILDVLNVLGLESRGIVSDACNHPIDISNPYNLDVEAELNNYINKSKIFIAEAIK